MTVTPSATLAPEAPDLVAVARDLAPMIAARVDTYRHGRDVPGDVVGLLKEAGLHRPYMPRRYGGFEMDWGVHYRVSRELAQACGSVGWLTGLVFSHVMFIGRFPVAGQDDFFTAAPDAILATASAGAGVLERTAGGLRLNGRWGWASGVRHAGGLMVIAKEGDGPLFTHFCLLLPGEYQIEDTWDSPGLHATGSHHVRVENVVVPPERLVERDVFLAPNPPGSEIHQGYVYRMRPAPLQKSYFMGPLLGTAKGALAAATEQTARRRGQILGETVAVQTPVQVNLGVAQAELDAAELIFDAYAEKLHAAGRANLDVDAATLLWGKRNVTFASRLCLAAADRVSASLGASGQMGSSRSQRLFTDCRSMTTHVELHWDHSMAPTGMRALGLPTGDPLIDGVAPNPGADRVMIGTQI